MAVLNDMPKIESEAAAAIAAAADGRAGIHPRRRARQEGPRLAC